MDSLRAIPPLIDFAVISLIGFKTLNTACFSPVDLNLSLVALVFSVAMEIYLIWKASLR